MKWIARSSWLLAALVFGTSVQGAPPVRATVGEKAPEVSPQKWFNIRENTTWEKLKGQVILVEKWATT